MMKPLMIGALSLAMAAPTAASAQSWRGDRDRDGRYERWEHRADHNRRDGGRYTHRERHRDWRRGQRDHWRDEHRYGPPYGNAWGYREQRWRRGAVIPHHYRRQWYVHDYHRHGWPPPPRGYGYYRTDTGDVLVAALATGVVLSLFND
ncbi:RcnB family protein [uncultured Brevundimonas sp.]|uniref:RcnB family protein n=1 Tax=uncultured Brevundimonas sp. TaxID=213418 RepID=UPI0026130891|nr:RcnB family protein [uncultured Brevundimonas sp.]